MPSTPMRDPTTTTPVGPAAATCGMEPNPPSGTAIDRQVLPLLERFGHVRPYAGLGMSINLIGDAHPLLAADESDEDVTDAVFERIDDRKSQAALLAMGGVQVQLGRAGVFGQASFMPANSRFLLDDSLAFFEFGVRYNFGGAREGIR
jgi:hypothetical protein